MKRDRVNYLAVGTFVLAMLAIGAWALLKITGRTGPTDEYTVHYGNVAGLKFGTPVYFEGYLIGQVTKVEPEHKKDGTEYRATLSVKHDWPIPKDSIAAMASSGLLGDVSISVLEGSSPERAKPGSELIGQDGSDVFTAFAALATEVKALAVSIRPLVQQLNDTLGKGAGPIVQDLRALLTKLNQSADGLNQMLGPDNRRNVSQTLEHVNAASANAQQLSAQLLNTRRQVDHLIAQADGMITENRPEVQQSVRELRISLQAVSQRIDAIMLQVDNTTRNMQEFSREIRASPGRLLNGAPPQDPGNKKESRK
jgi:phospholipid/cholesterol/gamma-HCH transport system substrate-binding protein